MPTVPEFGTSAAGAVRVAASIKQLWRDGEVPDAAAVLSAHPDLLGFKSVVVDLAYEEYCLREEAGEAPDADAFCGRMPAYRSSIHKVIDAHRLIADHPEWLAPPPAAWPSPGDVVEGLTVTAELGRGTFARAYLAFDPAAARPCVLKLSPAQGAGEGHALGPLFHPHVTGMYWARRTNGLTAICQPLLGMTTLEDAVESVSRAPAPARSADALLAALASDPDIVPPPGPGPVVRTGEAFAVAATAVAARIADALVYLHGRGVSHGDLKPSNVVLGPGGHPYLIDFNLAGSGAAPVAGGTLPYMAPELLRLYLGQPQAVDPRRADVYAFGVMTFELFAGRPPFASLPGLTGREAAAALLRQRTAGGGCGWPAGTRPPAHVARLVERCLHAVPEGRPNAPELAAALARWVADRRHWGGRVRLRAISGLAACTLAGVVLVAGSMRPSAAEPRTADEFFERGQEHLRRGNPAAALTAIETAHTMSPSPRTLAYSAYCYTLMGNPHAVARGREAVAAGGATAAVYANLGAALLQNKEYRTASRYLDEAVRTDPKLRVARYNRALARLLLGLDANGKPADLGCVEDIREVLKSPGPEAALAYFQAARMCAACSYLDPRLRTEAIGCLREAVRLGDDPTRFGREPLLRDCLSGHAEFDAFARMKHSAGPLRSANLRAVEPN